MVSKTTFKIRLSDIISNPSDLTQDEKNIIKKEVGDFVLEKIKADAATQKSSVSGQRWKGLSKGYKTLKMKTIGSGAADLELTGSMLESLTYEPYRDGIEVGIFDGEDVQKSDNHNKFSARARKTKLPKRQFLPGKGESLRSGIMKEVVLLAQSLLDDDEEDNNQQ